MRFYGTTLFASYGSGLKPRSRKRTALLWDTKIRGYGSGLKIRRAHFPSPVIIVPLINWSINGVKLINNVRNQILILNYVPTQNWVSSPDQIWDQNWILVTHQTFISNGM